MTLSFFYEVQDNGKMWAAVNYKMKLRVSINGEFFLRKDLAAWNIRTDKHFCVQIMGYSLSIY
jgi:hypothetical protein